LFENSWPFICIWIALAKIGCTIACISTHVRGSNLSHALSVANAHYAIVSERLMDNWITIASSTSTSIKQTWMWPSEYTTSVESISAFLLSAAVAPPMADSHYTVPKHHIATNSSLEATTMHVLTEDNTVKYSSMNPDTSYRTNVTALDPLFYIYTCTLIN